MSQDRYAFISDEDLLRHYYNDHDNKWLGILLMRYSLMLLGVCMKYLKNEEDAKDCVQQVYLKVINEIDHYKIFNFKSWIYMVTKNESLMRIRGQKEHVTGWDETINPGEEMQDEKNALQTREELFNHLEENIRKLKPEQQQCIDYFYLKKMSYSEISAATGFSVQQVKSYLQNGKRKLELLMKDYKHENF